MSHVAIRAVEREQIGEGEKTHPRGLIYIGTAHTFRLHVTSIQGTACQLLVGSSSPVMAKRHSPPLRKNKSSKDVDVIVDDWKTSAETRLRDCDRCGI